jgi:acid phosphatase type 7
MHRRRGVIFLVVFVVTAAVAARVPGPAATGRSGASAAVNCGSERRAVRTLADRPRLQPTRTTTLSRLLRRPRPRSLRPTRLPFERHVFRVAAEVTLVRRSAGGGVRLLLRRGGARLVAVVPSPACTTRASAVRRRQMARAARAARRCRSALVSGVAYFARRPGSSGKAATALELQPTLGFRCGLLRTAPAPDPVIAAAGDIACDPADSSFNRGSGTIKRCRQRATSRLLGRLNPAAVLALGDIQYYCGGYSAFLQSYDLSWGAFKSITHPSVGNHEYLTSGGTGCNAANAGANGYFTYFGAAAGQRGQGYYSYDVGSWHLIALNSNCADAGGCSAGTPQGRWLAADLAAHRNMCTLAYWHIPLFSAGGRARPNSKPFWQRLYANNADVILSAHDHTYERFAPQTPHGARDNARGIREFIVGTGGANHTSFQATAANSEVRNSTTYGVLKLTLHARSYHWRFVPVAGQAFADSGSGSCH